MSKDQQLSDNMSALRMLGEMGIIDPLSSAFGVARVYLHKGLDGMTQEQRLVFDQQVAPILLHKCVRCDDYVQVSTLPDAYEHGSMLCSRHLAQRKSD
ncbi:MAG TPA: hypothetical protein VET30_01765 [Pseudoxanthomonas sp.]|nr:hypothetical protein [Pseudoxanthomonas sp.]